MRSPSGPGAPGSPTRAPGSERTPEPAASGPGDDPASVSGEIGSGDPFAVPIDGVLDLHTFRPAEVKVVVTEYLECCRQRGILRLRIIHGKGIGQLRQTVHTLLRRLPEVESFSLASEPFGGWGATIVRLKPAAPPGPEKPAVS